jgi:glycosyltransferase involved in cell wall biosynthesis
MAPLRILYPLLWHHLGRSACSEQTANTVAALSRCGHELTLLLPARRDDAVLTAADIRAYFDVEGDFRLERRVTRVGDERLGSSLLWLRQIFADPRTRHHDVLLARVPALLAAGRASPIPFAIDHYRPWPDVHPAARPLMRWTARARNCLGLIIHSQHAAGSYRRIGIAGDRILVAHNGAEPRRLGAQSSRDAAREKLGLPADRAVVVYAGRLNLQKGLDQLLAVARLRPELLFLLVGSEGNGPVEEWARAEANVRVIGWQEPAALAPWLRAADILVIPPSRAPLEQFGNCVLPLKLFAYLAAGRPIVAPALPDTAELLTDGETALLVPPEQPEIAASAFDRVLSDRALADRLGHNARVLSAELSWDNRAAKISRFLSQRLEEIGESAGSRA